MSRSSEEKKALSAWSDVIRGRAGWKCEKCGRKNCKLDAHHIEGKGHCGTYLKYALHNGICLCSSCHTFGAISAHSTSYSGQEAFRAWLKSYMGQEHLNRLREEINIKIKYSIPQLREITKKYRKEAKKV